MVIELDGGISCLALQIGFPNDLVSFSQPWSHKVQHLLITLGRLKIFFLFQAFSPSLKPLGLISTFAPLGMLDLS
jgi:hypothetical protein